MKAGDIFSHFLAQSNDTEPTSDMAPNNRITKPVAAPKTRFRFFGWELIPQSYLDQILAAVPDNKNTSLVTSDDDHKSPDVQTRHNISTATDNKVGDAIPDNESHNDEIERISDDDDQEQDDDEDDEEEDDQDDIYTWGPFRDISDDRFVNLINRHLHVMNSNSYEVVNRKEGAYHHVVFLDNGIENEKVVVKVPVVGLKSRWDPAHGKILQSEAGTMTYIKNKLPNFPIPRVHCYDTGFDNEIGAPFLLLSCAQGQTSQHIWFHDLSEADEDEEESEAVKDSISKGSEDQEKLRTAFLTSLAENMAQLAQLEFDGLGMLFLKDNAPVIEPFQGWSPMSHDELTRHYWERPVFHTSSEYYNSRVDEQFVAKTGYAKSTAMNMVLHQVFNSPPFSSSKQTQSDNKETFTLLHNDLDFQNILVSDSGEVTAILDWDGCGTAPRCSGSAALPLFLQKDWDDGYDLLAPYTLPPWRLAYYRKIYADAMNQAQARVGSITDGIYTEKSHFYGVAHRVLFGDNSSTFERAQDFIEKLMREIPAFRTVSDIEEFLKKLGSGWRDAEEMLKEYIPKLVNCKAV